MLHMWSILIATLPTQPNAVRLRIWRALKGLGAASLRDGAYLLPQTHTAKLQALADEVNQHGGNAQVMQLAASDKAQEQNILALFDRSEAYVQWQATAQQFMAALPQLQETEARRRARQVADALQTLQAMDYYPAEASVQAGSELAQLRSALDARFSGNEPHAQSGPIERLKPAKFQGKRWATRARPWVDRLASAWLIRRFIDTQAEFIWLANTTQLPRGAIGFDFDGARFSHVESRVTFEVLLASFGLEHNQPLQALARLVHFLDAGGIPVPQAAGLEAVLAGLRTLHANDDDLLKAASSVFDALLAQNGKAL